MNDEITVTVRGKRWKLMFIPLKGDADGTCDPPDAAGKAIRINSSLKDERRMEVVVHELLHAGHWDLDEKAVEETARDIARALWRIGYRDTD